MSEIASYHIGDLGAVVFVDSERKAAVGPLDYCVLFHLNHLVEDIDEVIVSLLFRWCEFGFCAPPRRAGLAVHVCWVSVVGLLGLKR